MIKQEVLSTEEVEWDTRLREKEQSILEAQEDKNERTMSQLSNIWDVLVNGWYKPYHEKDLQKDIDHDDSLRDWLETLRVQGVTVAAYSTWRKKYEIIVTCIASGMTLDRALLIAAKSSDTVQSLKSGGAIEVKTEDGSSLLTTGKPVVVTPGANFDKLGVDTVGEYLEKLADMPSGRDISDTIRVDMKIPNVSVSAMWEGQESQGVEWRTFTGEMWVEDEQGGTPYQFTLKVEKSIPKTGLRRFLNRLSQKFSHLAEAK